MADLPDRRMGSIARWWASWLLERGTHVSVFVCMVAAAVVPSACTSNTQPRFLRTSRIVAADSIVRPLRSSQKVSLTVTSDVFEDPPGSFSYKYTVASAGHSRDGVELFGIRQIPPPDSVESPAQWGAFYGFDEEDSSVVWAVTDTLTGPPAGWDSVQVYPSPYEIQPGQQKVFRIVSKQPPAVVSFSALGFKPLPSMADDYTTLWTSGVTGSVIGPDIQSVTGVGQHSTIGIPGILHGPVSNPTPGMATISYYLASRSRVLVAVFDIRGRLVKSVRNEIQNIGYHSATWGGEDTKGVSAAVGIYFFRVGVDGKEIGAREVALVR